MSQQTYEQIIALDSCLVIEVLQKPILAKRVWVLFKGKHSRIALQDIVLQEVSRITKLSKEEVLFRTSSLLHKEVYVFSTDNSMREYANQIEKKYNICHFPDSIILAACKFTSRVLLTLDHNMIRAAEFEGILAFNPKRVRRI